MRGGRSQISPALIIKLYVEHDMSSRRIAEMAGIGHPRVLGLLKRRGVRTRREGKQDLFDARHHKYRGIDLVHCRDLYEKQGLSTKAIAKKFGVSQTAIYTWLREIGTNFRPRGKHVRDTYAHQWEADN